jgi:hypothetical protein
MTFNPFTPGGFGPSGSPGQWVGPGGLGPGSLGPLGPGGLGPFGPGPSGQPWQPFGPTPSGPWTGPQPHWPTPTGQPWTDPHGQPQPWGGAPGQFGTHGSYQQCIRNCYATYNNNDAMYTQCVYRCMQMYGLR